jgi:hypothetical protein
MKLADKRAANKAAHLARDRNAREREGVEVIGDEITATDSDEGRDEGQP